MRLSARQLLVVHGSRTLTWLSSLYRAAVVLLRWLSWRLKSNVLDWDVNHVRVPSPLVRALPERPHWECKMRQDRWLGRRISRLSKRRVF